MRKQKPREVAARDHNWRVGRIAALRGNARLLAQDIIPLERVSPVRRLIDGLCHILDTYEGERYAARCAELRPTSDDKPVAAPAASS